MIHVVDGLSEACRFSGPAGSWPRRIHGRAGAGARGREGATPPSTRCRRADSPRQAPLRDAASDAVPW